MAWKKPLKGSQREDSNLRPLDPESDGVPSYIVDLINITSHQFLACATFVPLYRPSQRAFFGLIRTRLIKIRHPSTRPAASGFRTLGQAGVGVLPEVEEFAVVLAGPCPIPFRSAREKAILRLYCPFLTTAGPRRYHRTPRPSLRVPGNPSSQIACLAAGSSTTTTR